MRLPTSASDRGCGPDLSGGLAAHRPHPHRQARATGHDQGDPDLLAVLPLDRVIRHERILADSGPRRDHDLRWRPMADPRTATVTYTPTEMMIVVSARQLEG